MTDFSYWTDNDPNYLSHHGVLGMKWGVRHDKDKYTKAYNDLRYAKSNLRRAKMTLNPHKVDSARKEYHKQKTRNDLNYYSSLSKMSLGKALTTGPTEAALKTKYKNVTKGQIARNYVGNIAKGTVAGLGALYAARNSTKIINGAAHTAMFFASGGLKRIPGTVSFLKAAYKMKKFNEKMNAGADIMKNFTGTVINGQVLNAVVRR